MEAKKEKVRMENGEINFSCLVSDCPSSCCGPFGGVHGNLDSLNNIDFGEISLTTNDSNKIISSGHARLIELVGENYRMKLNSDGSCSAFIDGKCSIHSSKPSICRAFPFYVDMFVGLCVASGSCPGCGGDGWTKLKDLTEEISAAKEIYNFWLENLSDQT
ncbi:MAG TPA: YkgJ family cysteine cluster protein [Flavipsychrobacter sp.]|nr:YkgJ family cysteine cluster protein [Flavipsychrobacter sp.]